MQLVWNILWLLAVAFPDAQHHIPAHKLSGPASGTPFTTILPTSLAASASSTSSIATATNLAAALTSSTSRTAGRHADSGRPATSASSAPGATTVTDRGPTTVFAPHTTRHVSLGYTLIDRWRLERSLLSWLHSIGALTGFVHDGDGGGGGQEPPTDFQVIEEACRHGTLLCKLVGLIGGPAIVGVFAPPKTYALAVSNVLKAIR